MMAPVFALAVAFQAPSAAEISTRGEIIFYERTHTLVITDVA